MLMWLEKNIQRGEFNLDGSGRRSIEWNSLDKESWSLRISGAPPKVQVGIKDPELELIFLLQWQ